MSFSLPVLPDEPDVAGPAGRIGCGVPLPPRESGRARQFCSDECRRRHYNALRGTAAPAPPPAADGAGAALGRLGQLLSEAGRLAAQAAVQAAEAAPERAAATGAQAAAAPRPARAPAGGPRAQRPRGPPAR